MKARPPSATFEMPRWQRRACAKALVIGALIGLATIAIVFTDVRQFTAVTYRLSVTVASQGRSAHSAIAMNAPAVGIVLRAFRNFGLAAASDSDTRAALDASGRITATTIHAQTLTVRSQARKVLDAAIARIQAESPWPVTSLENGGEFAPAQPRRGVHLWRIRSALKSASSTTIQINGPAVTLGYVDYLAGAMICALVVSFGSLERTSRDVSSFPPGLHPFVMATQVVLIALLVCVVRVLWALHDAANLGYVLISALSIISIARWLVKSRLLAI